MERDLVGADTFSAGVPIAPLCEQAGWQMSGHVLLNLLADRFGNLLPAHYDDRDHPLRRIATTCYDRLRPVKAPLGPLGDSQYSCLASSALEAVPVVNRRGPRALRSALTADAAARAGGAC